MSQADVIRTLVKHPYCRSFWRADATAKPMTETKRGRRKSFWLAFVLALVLGPFGLLYVSWK
jgi:hypothetical protein